MYYLIMYKIDLIVIDKTGNTMESKIADYLLTDLNIDIVKRIRPKVINFLLDLKKVAKQKGINLSELYTEASKHNQYDKREKRHIMYLTQEEKTNIQENEKVELREMYDIESQGLKISAYDIIRGEMRIIDKEKEYLIAFVSKEERDALCDAIPPYIKIQVLDLSECYLIEVPLPAASLTTVPLYIAPIKKTIMIGKDGYSPNIECNTLHHPKLNYTLSFMDAYQAEKIDDEYVNMFWFFENYNSKKKYHCIYSNSRKSKSINIEKE